MKVPFLPKTKSLGDEQLMREIVKNVKSTANRTYSLSKLLGLCRVSFLSTYGRFFKGNLLEIWDKTE